MSGLSNLWRHRDGPATEVRPVAPGEIATALSLLLGTGDQLADHRAVIDFEHLAAQRQIDLTKTVVATLDGRVAAAALPVPSPGRTVLMLLSPAGRSTLAARLVAACADAACDGLREGQLVQVLLDSIEARAAQALAAADFVSLATLIYLQRRLKPSVVLPADSAGLNWVHYSAATHARFVRAIEASYEQSLDCPAMRGLRTTDDVIAGHRATGEFDSSLWYCFTDGDAPDAAELGVLLLAPVTGQPMMELVYLGLAPAARGRRLGDKLMTVAAHATTARGLDLLTLAVDDRNVPALRLYYRSGLAEIARREALFRRPGATSGRTNPSNRPV